MSNISPSASPAPSAYDETPYLASAIEQSHPNRLGGMAGLFGIEAKLPSAARVLELGCADGSNLLPMAERAPGGSFLGLDSSSVQIAAGVRAMEKAGIKNAELRVQNIADFPASEGKFDYIVAHGVYSYVPDSVREKILAICENHLADKGIAYISYNALPGWNMRQSLRDMVLYHTRTLPDPKAKVGQARALIKFLSDAVPAENSPYGQLLQSELRTIAGVDDSHLRHEMLDEENTAFYFADFIRHAGAHGLQYLSEPSISHMLASNFPESVTKTLAQIGNSIRGQEQYMDFLKNRTFRQTLLCRREVSVSRNIGPERLKPLAFRSMFKAPATQSVNLAHGVAVNFETQGGQQVTVTDSFLKAVFQVLAQHNRGILTYAELLSAAQRMHGDAINPNAPEDAILALNLVNLLGQGLVEVYSEPLDTAILPPERPAASPLMRYQALNARAVINRVHQGVAPDVFVRNLIELCDGNRTKPELINALISRAKDGVLQVAEAGNAVTDPERLRALIEPRLNSTLTMLTQLGLFAS